MIVISLCMMCVMGVGYHRNILLKLFCLIPAVMSMAVIVLTQSRTSRYALLAVLAAAAFDGVRRVLCRRNVAAVCWRRCWPVRLCWRRLLGRGQDDPRGGCALQPTGV